MNFVKDSLRENIFWLRIMKEHAIFIRLGLPCEEKTLIQQAKEFEQLFRRLEERAKNTSEQRQAVKRLNEDVIAALERFIGFKTKILNKLITCQLRFAELLPLLVDHIRREAIRFKVILLRLQNNIELVSAEEALKEEIFWLRIMGEHAHFIAHLLDPSERKLVKQSENFAKNFEQLRLQAEDLQSMEVPQEFENSLLPATNLCEHQLPTSFCELPQVLLIPRLKRFNGEAIQATEQILLFKAVALQLIQQCKVLSIIPPLLAAHILREAMKAVEDLTNVQKSFGAN